LNQAPAPGATDRNPELSTTTSAARQMAAFVTRSRPPAADLSLASVDAKVPAPAPTPRTTNHAPRPATNPANANDPSAAIVAAFIAGPDAQKTVSELIAATRLPRGTVCSTIAALADAERVTRQLVDVGPWIMVRWSLRR
jgi:hypothetical protein